MSDINNIQNSLEHLETNALNPIGRAPVASSVTGTCRAIIAIAQISLGALGYLFGVAFEEREAAYYGGHHFMHGIMNFSRAILEVIPLVNLIPAAYDSNTEWNDANANPHRFSYISYERAYAEGQ